MAALSEAPVPTTRNDPEPWNLARLVTHPAGDPKLRLPWLGAVLCLGLFALLFWDSLAVRRELQSRLPGPADQSLFCQPGGTARPCADPRG
jgi:hypothetical protein